MFANMAAALIKHEQISTTLPKAKDLQADCREAGDARQERGPACAAAGDLPDRRRGAGQKAVCRSGRSLSATARYTRVLKAGFRYGDSAPMAVIELVDRNPDEKGKDSRPAAERGRDGDCLGCRRWQSVANGLLPNGYCLPMASEAPCRRSRRLHRRRSPGRRAARRARECRAASPP